MHLKNNSLLNRDVAEGKLRVAKCLAITEGQSYTQRKAILRSLPHKIVRGRLLDLPSPNRRGKSEAEQGTGSSFSARGPVWSVLSWKVLFTVLARTTPRVLQVPSRQEREALEDLTRPALCCSSSGHPGGPWRPTQFGDWSESWKPVFSVAHFAGKGRGLQFFSLPTQLMINLC